LAVVIRPAITLSRNEGSQCRTKYVETLSASWLVAGRGRPALLRPLITNAVAEARGEDELVALRDELVDAGPAFAPGTLSRKLVSTFDGLRMNFRASSC
jgi:hypothetical protein